MDALQKARQLVQRVAKTGDTEMHAHNERNELNELSQPDSGGEEVNSFNSFLSFAENAPFTPSAPVAQLHEWLVRGQLDALPDPVPGFPDDLARYRDRETLIAFTRQILDSAPWSLTGEDRAAQFVAILTPLLIGRRLQRWQ